METTALLFTASVQLAQNWAPVLMLSPAICWWAVWGEEEAEQQPRG